MAWAHSQQLAVLPNGTALPYPVLVSSASDRPGVVDTALIGLKNSLKSLANGGACRTNFDVAFYAEAALTTLLPFEPDITPGASEEHDLTTGDVLYWVGVPKTQGVYWIAWSDASVTGSLKNVPDVWTDYVSTPNASDGGITKGVVLHLSDDAATQVVVNSCDSDCTAGITNFSPGTTTSAVAATGIIGGGFQLTGSNTPGNGIDTSPQVIHFTSGPPQNPKVSMCCWFKPTSADLTGLVALTDTVYFAESGYFLGLQDGHLILQGSNLRDRRARGTLSHAVELDLDRALSECRILRGHHG